MLTLCVVTAFVALMCDCFILEVDLLTSCTNNFNRVFSFNEMVHILQSTDLSHLSFASSLSLAQYVKDHIQEM